MDDSHALSSDLLHNGGSWLVISLLRKVSAPQSNRARSLTNRQQFHSSKTWQASFLSLWIAVCALCQHWGDAFVLNAFLRLINAEPFLLERVTCFFYPNNEQNIKKLIPSISSLPFHLGSLPKASFPISCLHHCHNFQVWQSTQNIRIALWGWKSTPLSIPAHNCRLWFP